MAVKAKRLTKAEKAKLAEERIAELTEQIGWSDDLWGASDHLKKYLTRFEEHDHSDLDNIHYELERLTELVGLIRDR